MHGTLWARSRQLLTEFGMQNPAGEPQHANQLISNTCGMSVAAQVRIFDTTLRDGEQSPGCTLTSKEKLAIAKQLAKLGGSTCAAGMNMEVPAVVAKLGSPLAAVAEIRRLDWSCGLSGFAAYRGGLPAAAVPIHAGWLILLLTVCALLLHMQAWTSSRRASRSPHQTTMKACEPSHRRSVRLGRQLLLAC